MDGGIKIMSYELSQKMLGVLLIICGILLCVLLNEVSGAGFMIALLGIIRVIFKDQGEGEKEE